MAHQPPAPDVGPAMAAPAAEVIPRTQLVDLEGHMRYFVSHAKTWDRTDSFKLTSTNLNSLAIIATFLAGVQAQIISSSITKNDTKLEIACNALFFGGLFVDVLSGSIAIIGSVYFQRTYRLLQLRESSLSRLRNVAEAMNQVRRQDGLALVNHLRTLEMVIFPPLHTPRLWNSLSGSLKESEDLMQQMMTDHALDDSLRIPALYALEDYRDTTNQLAKSRLGTSLGFVASLIVFPLILAGLGCFIAGAICLVLDGQPKSVRITSLAVVGGTILLFLVVLGFSVKDPRSVKPPFDV
ncbi:hypothetical protein MVEN_01495600 [Mycena venus]|uniref:Uncharacterized protein n=1 Tax=Mycena venus TaxID=2733690 RepID=A0A8H7CU08_9AGAR|nr:hypothetical protein MVEN_01495600 [Mycena venus]